MMAALLLAVLLLAGTGLAPQTVRSVVSYDHDVTNHAVEAIPDVQVPLAAPQRNVLHSESATVSLVTSLQPVG